MIVVADATPLLYLSRIERLDIARALCMEVLIPREVHRELVEKRPDADGVEELRASWWIVIADAPTSIPLDQMMDASPRDCRGGWTDSDGSSAQRLPILTGALRLSTASSARAALERPYWSARWLVRSVRGQGCSSAPFFMCRYCAVTRGNWIERDGIGGNRKGSSFVVLSREKRAKFAFRMGLLGDYDEGFDSRQLHDRLQ